MGRLVRLLPLALLGLAGLLALPASAAAAATPGILAGYGGPFRVRPAAFAVSGDGGFYFTGVDWTRVTTRSATATATEHRNDCVPTCAGGRMHERRVRLLFTGVRPYHGALIFTRMRDGGRWYDLPQ